MAHSVSLSRGTSRTSKTGSNKSRSLIKKHIEMHDLNAADLLIERFTAWKIIVKQLASWFEGYADIENNAAREMIKLSAIIQVPFRSGNHFLGEGGLQDVFYGIRDKSRQISDQHADLGRTINSSIVQHLQKLLVEIKAHLDNVQNDTAKLATSVAKEREASAKLIGELANDISVFRNTPMGITAKRDPYLANQRVFPQLQKQVIEENLLQKSVIVMQQNSAHFEEGIVRAIQSAWQTFDEWQSRAAGSNQEMYRSLSAHLASLPADREWISFAARSNHLLDPETPLRDPAYINYPHKEDPSVFAVHTGHLERKKRYSRNFQESYFVLTPAGFLHAFDDSDPSHPSGRGLSPIFSLFLPNCTLGPPSPANAKSHKFHIDGRKDGTGAAKSGGLRGMLGGDNTPGWTFRARSREEMMEWWNDLRMLCARYLIASEQVERNGPVETAVRSVGYHTEEEEEGSSGEEGVDEGYHEATTSPRQTGYIYEKGAEVGDHGYAIERKPVPSYDTHAERTIRQHEKAPEGQVPQAYDAAEIDQDAAHVTAQTTGTTHEPSAHPSKYIRATGYVPDELAVEAGHAEHDVGDTQFATSGPQQASYTGPQRVGAGITQMSPQQSIQRAASPRGTSMADPHRQDSPSPQMPGSSSPRPGGLGPRPHSPREAASTAAYASGTTSSQYAQQHPEAAATHEYDPLAAGDDVVTAPVEASYTGEER